MGLARQEQRISDSALVLKTAGLVAVSAAEATILDIGTAEVRGELVVDVSAIESGTGDESFVIVLQVSNNDDMSSQQVAVTATFGPLSANPNGATGRYVYPFSNVINDTVYRYVRLYTVVGGTIATGINYAARLTL